MDKDKNKFIEYCAEVINIKLEEDVDFDGNHVYLEYQDRPFIKYNPYNDLNQMVVVVEKLMTKDWKGVMIMPDSDIKKAFRDFIISAMENDNGDN